MEGIILKALSGFYYVDGGDGVLVACRGRGKFRHQRITPLVGDKVIFTPLDNGAGILDEILPRRNEFQRPAVANIDQAMVVFAAAVAITRYVSLGSILVMICFFIGMVICGARGDFGIAAAHLTEFYVLAGLISVMGIWRHHANIKRLLNGTENKLGARKES